MTDENEPTAIAYGNADQLAEVARALEAERNRLTIITTNEYAIGSGENLPNHSSSLAGRGKFVRQMVPDVPTFRTKQQAYRYAAYLLALASTFLPDEEGAHTFEEVCTAIENA